MGNVKYLKSVVKRHKGNPEKINSAEDFIEWSIKTKKHPKFVAEVLLDAHFYTIPTAAIGRLYKRRE